jgi:hypothetical protein
VTAADRVGWLADKLVGDYGSEAAQLLRQYAELLRTPAEQRVAKLEADRDTLLNALCAAVERVTGQMPMASEIRRRFLDAGELPALPAVQPFTLSVSAEPTLSFCLLLDGKPHRLCDCADSSRMCPRSGADRAGTSGGQLRCAIPAPDVFIAVTEGA